MTNILKYCMNISYKIYSLIDNTKTITFKQQKLSNTITFDNRYKIYLSLLSND
jgi:hypothetical protein